MKKSLQVLFLLVAFFVSFMDAASAQSVKDYATVNIYREKTIVGSNAFGPIYLNDNKIVNLTNNSKLTYKIYSEGVLVVRMGTNDPISLYVEHGKTYYVRISMRDRDVDNRLLEVSEEQGSIGFNMIPSYNLTFKEENKRIPIIPPDKQKVDNTKQNNNLANQENVTQPVVVKQQVLSSDVDVNIPTADGTNQYRYALIIGNEDYSSQQKGLDNEANVEFAVNDAKAFKEYSIRMLGIPEDNIIYIENAKAVELSRSIKAMASIIKNTNGKCDVFVYYAGHGLPSETENEPYIIPVDVTGSDLQYALKLSDLYSQLTEFPSQRITIILDACFSGGARGQSLIAARGVKVRPKEYLLTGNIVVFSACSGDQTSLAYKEKQHGLFTYFFLKKLQETKGDITYDQLSEYLKEKVGVKSVLVHNKEQNPQTLVSPNITDKLTTWTIK